MSARLGNFRHGVKTPITARMIVSAAGGRVRANCAKSAEQDERIEHVARYGRAGQAQQGIDLFVRLANGKYEVWQAKRYKAVSASDVKTIIQAFREGSWAARAEKLILAVQASLADTKVQEAIEREAAMLKESGITFLPRDGDELSTLLHLSYNGSAILSLQNPEATGTRPSLPDGRRKLPEMGQVRLGRSRRSFPRPHNIDTKNPGFS